MEFEQIVSIAIKVIGGLGLFLLGMKNMSEGMQAVAGNRLRSLINAVTNNRFIGCAVGTLVTMMIQSSSVTTVMLVGFVNAGLMTLSQAIGVILGADIGTTITAWLFVLPIAKCGLPMLGIAAFFYLFSKNDRIRFSAMAIMGLGMVFFGLELMKSGFSPLQDMEGFKEWLGMFSPTNTWGVIKCALVGALVTAIVQSSSATVVITMGLATTGMIDFKTAAALVLGQNIGTTITAYLASIGTSQSAKRVAYAHILIKIIAVLIAVPIFYRYVDFIIAIVGINPDAASLREAVTGASGETVMQLTKDGVRTMGRAIATSHTIFNVGLTCLFIPFVTPMVRFLNWLVPDKKTREAPHLTHLDIRMLETPALGIEQSRKECIKMAEGVDKMMLWLEECTMEGVVEEDNEKQRKLFRREEIMDTVQREVTVYLSALLSGNVPHDVTDQARAQLRIVDEYESVSDYISDILIMHRRFNKDGMKITEQGSQHLKELHARVASYIKMINEGVEHWNTDILAKSQSEADFIDRLVKECRFDHLNRIQSEQLNPLSSLIFPDILNAYRRIKDHALNIAEALAGEK